MRDIEREKKFADVCMRYFERFSEGYPLEMAPALSEDELIALYERCLAEDKPYIEYVKIQYDRDLVY